jgi:hypothetical protein
MNLLEKSSQKPFQKTVYFILFLLNKMACDYPYVSMPLETRISNSDDYVSTFVYRIKIYNNGIFFMGIPDEVLNEYLTSMFQTYQYAIPIRNTGVNLSGSYITTGSKSTPSMRTKTWEGFSVSKEQIHFVEWGTGKVSDCLFNEWRDKIAWHLSKIKRFGPDGGQYSEADTIYQTNRDANYIVNLLLYEEYIRE